MNLKQQAKAKGYATVKIGGLLRVITDPETGKSEIATQKLIDSLPQVITIRTGVINDGTTIVRPGQDPSSGSDLPSTIEGEKIPTVDG